MKKKMTMKLFAASCVLAVVANCATAQTTTAPKKAQTKKLAKEKITLEIRGSQCAKCASVLTETLTKNGVHAKVGASKDKPFRLETEINRMTDLGACGMAIMEAKTPHHDEMAPELDLVMFAKLDKASSEKAMKALAAVKGIDASHSTADAKTGEISIRLTAGGDKVTADSLHKVLHDAGLTASFTKPSERKAS